MRNPDGYRIEVGQYTQLALDWFNKEGGNLFAELDGALVGFAVVPALLVLMTPGIGGSGVQVKGAANLRALPENL